MATKQKHRVSGYNPRPTQASNETQNVLYDAMETLGKKSMRISDIPKFLKQTKKELNKGK